MEDLMNRTLKRSALLLGLAAIAASGTARFATADPPAAKSDPGIPTAAAPVTATAVAATAAIDQKAPDFSLAGIDGKTYKLSDFKGKYVVLEWNNLDCPFVK